MKLKLALTILAALAFTASAQAKFYVPKHGARCKTHYVKHTVRIAKRHHGKLVRHHHKIVMVKQARCVYVAAKKPTTTTAPVPTASAPVTTTAPLKVRAGLDPSFTQDAADNLHVTWSYSANATDTLPDGTLTLGVQEPGKTGNTGGCSMNVGGGTTGGTCTVELSHYGNWAITVSYAGSDTTVSPATSTDTEDIEPLPATIAKTWGTDAPSNQPAIAATVIGSTANVTVTDANYEGAASVLVSDQNGDSCTAPISGTTASCQMSLGPNVTPTSFHVAYPGGASTQSTRTVQPGDGTQSVTTTWPSQTVAVTNPSVTVQQATVTECGGSQQGGPWNSTTGCASPGAANPWPNPITTTTNRQIQLYAVTYGSVASDRDPTQGNGQVSGFLTFNVTGGIESTDYTASDFQNGPDNSTDCSEVTTQSYDAGSGAYGPDEPTGTCALKFLTPGIYTVTVSYTSEDTNYASVQGVDSETIDVAP